MFPASFPTVIYLAAFAAISSFISMEPMGLLIGLFVYYFFVSFAYTVLEYSARGELQRLHASTTGFFFRAENIIKQLFIFFFLVGINFLIYGLAGESVFKISVSLGLCLFPVIAVQLVKHNNPLKMFSPAEISTTFRVMGKTYWLLSMFCIMLFFSAQLALQLIPSSPNSYMNLAINHFVVFYFCLVFFSMLGYGLYQFYDQLGLEPDSTDGGLQVADTSAMGGLIKQVNIMIKEGYLEKAGKELLKVIETNPGDLNSWQRYFKILLLESNVAELNRFAQEYINYLLGHEKDMEAMDVYLDVQRNIADFRPKTGVQAFALANRLRAHGHAGLALNLLNNMHKHYRGYEGIAKAYMLAAQILCEQFGEDIKARKILNFIIKKYPQSIFASEATDYLKVVDRLAVR
jgi:tetratricopeptide (TPR) repeat protein